MKALIIEDHTLFAHAFKYLLLETKLITEVLTESDSQFALDKIIEFKPKLLFLDLNMPITNGIDILTQIQIQKIKTKVIIVSMVSEPSVIAKAIMTGASGFVPKNTSYKELKLVIEKVLNNENYIPDIFKTDVENQIKILGNIEENNLGNSKSNELSNRELEILKLIAQGYTNNEISEMLFISPLTVKTHRTNILKKLNIKNTAALVHYASSLGII